MDRSNEEIPVVLASDDGYAFQTRITIESIRKNTKVKLKIIILHDEGLSDDGKKILSENNKEDIEFVFVNHIISKSYDKSGYISSATMLRLILPEILKCYSKCIYLDGDLILMTDINKIMEIDVDGFYLAGVRDFGINDKHAQDIGLANADFYVNAGVLVMNLQKMREDKLQNLFIEDSQKKLPYEDQDILNKNCYGAIKLLNLKYNTFARAYTDDKTIVNQLDNCFGKDCWREEIKNPYILHYSGAVKPWNNTRSLKNNAWWEIVESYAEHSTYLLLREKVNQQCRHRDLSELYKVCEEEKEVVIFGFSNISKSIFDYLLKRNYRSVKTFCDNDIIKQGIKYKGVEVLSLKESISKYKDALFIISSQKYWKDIYNQLLHCGISDDKIWRYEKKTDEYYLMLEPKYMEFERKDEMDEGLC